MASPGPDQETYFTGSDETKIEASVTNIESEVLFGFRGVQSILKNVASTFKQNDQSLKTTGPNVESTDEAILTNSVRNLLISNSARETILMESQDVSSADSTNELNQNRIEAINTDDFQNEGSLSERALDQQIDSDEIVKFKGHDLHLEERDPFNKEISKYNDCLEDTSATTEEQLNVEVSDEILSETYEGQKDLNRYHQAERFDHQNVDNTNIITSGSSGKPLMEEKSKESQNSHIYFYENDKNGLTLAKDKPSDATMVISDLDEMVCKQHEVTSDIYNMNESSQDTSLHTGIMSKIKEQPTFAKHLSPKFDFYSLIVPKWKKCFPQDLEENGYISKVSCKAFIYRDASQISQSEQIKTRVKEDQSQDLQLPAVKDWVSKNDFTDTTDNHDVSVDKKEPEYFKKEEQSVSEMEDSLESIAVSIQGQDQHLEFHSSEVSIINKGKDQDVNEMELQQGYLIHYKERLSIVTDKPKTHIRSKLQQEEWEHSCKNLIYTYDRNNLDHVTELSWPFEENKEIMQKKTEDDSSKIQTAVHNEAKLDIKLKERNNECVTTASDNTCLPQQKLFEKIEASTSWPGDKIKNIKHENITLGNALKNQESDVSQETNERESQQHKLPKQEFTQIENEQQEIEQLSVVEDKGQKIAKTLHRDFSSVLLNDVHFQQTKEALTKNKLFEVSHSKVPVETYEEKHTIDKSNKGMIVEEGHLPFSAMKNGLPNIFKQHLTRVQEIHTSPYKAVLPNGDVEDQSRNIRNNKQYDSTNILDYEKDTSLEEQNCKGHIKHFHPVESSENDNSIVQSDVSKAMARTQEEDVQERGHKTHFGVSPKEHQETRKSSPMTDLFSQEVRPKLLPFSSEQDLESTKDLERVKQFMSEEDIDFSIEAFGLSKLLWINNYLDFSKTLNAKQNEMDGLNIICDLEQNLNTFWDKSALDIKTTGEKHMTASDIQSNIMTLQKLKHILSTLKSKYATHVCSKEKQDENIPGCIREACQETRKDIKADKYEQTKSAPEVRSWKVPSQTKSTVTPIMPHKRDVYTSLNTIKEGGMAILKSLQASSLYQPLRLGLESFGKQAVSALPEDMRPGPDLYGFPWEAVIITAFLGIVTALLFLFRLRQSIKSRLYAGREKQLGAKIAELLEEKCSILETLSECTQQHKKLEDKLSNGGLIDQVTEKENMQAMCVKLEQSNTDMKDEIKRINVDLNIQKSTRTQQNQLLEEMLTSLRSLEKETESIKSEIEQTHTTLKVYEISSVKLHTNLQAAKEENLHLKESEAQLSQEVEGWGERLGELAEQIKICEMSQKEMQEDCSNKECQIKSLTDCLLKMKDWDSEIEEEIDGDKNTEMENEANSDHQKQKIEKLIHAAKVNAALKSVDEDKNQLLARLNDEMKAKEDLQERIDKLQNNKDFLLARSSEYTTEIEKLQQKLQIMTEMYQENELKLHRKLTIEEKERMQKEEKLTKADEKISLAAEELNSYRLRAKELDEELDRTNQSYKNQIASHEKKAHDNWLAARAAERDLTEIKREKAHFRQKLTDAQFKLEMIQKDPYALDVPGMHPFRGERSPFGPSPLGRPASETRAFLSPPTLVDGPPRISPHFPAGPGGRASREPQILADHPMLSEGVDPNSERILDNRSTHSDSGSLSPTWDRDRRVHVPPPPGYPYIDPTLPFRRPPSGRLSGPAEIRGLIPPSADKTDAPDVNISEGPGNNMNEIKDPPAPIPGGPFHPAEADLRFGPPVIRPLLDPREQFIHGGRYGPPEFLPVRGPVPLLPRGRPPLLPGMFPRFPFLPPGHGYPPLRPPTDGSSGLPYRPSPPGDEQTEN
ncbi:uncharacterized protein ctage5 isoform X2 [Erpetoichthys calabaricus]|uniref:uncharacterized protein ctage5 isoform X2 n=1 Tax=Erpetoichthys calabaricus TaxID=27687 RepID=UPI0022346522|nr:uncharacterized protein ctage5 isoform X2 [Erpetoichthys calabaricus]